MWLYLLGVPLLIAAGFVAYWIYGYERENRKL